MERCDNVTRRFRGLGGLGCTSCTQTRSDSCGCSRGLGTTHNENTRGASCGRGLGAARNENNRGYGSTGRENTRSGCGCNGGTTRNESTGGCGCGCNSGSDYPRQGAATKRGCHTLMHKLQELDFAIQETVLYLDAYPKCAEALAHYQALVKERCAVAKQYEAEYGPLTNRGNESHQDWDWVSAPWPWHPDFPANGNR